MPVADDVQGSPRTSNRAPSPCRESGTGGAIRVAVIEDNRVVREALGALFSGCPGIHVTVAAPNGHERVLREFSPDVILLHLGLETGESLRMAWEVLEGFPEARIVVMDLPPAYEGLEAFVSAGVSGFVMKDAPLDVALETLRRVASGLKVLPDPLTAVFFSRIAGKRGTDGRSGDQEEVRLTPREQEVIELIAEGLSNRAIAKRLDISVHTVKSHLRNIMDKLTLHSRLQIATYVHKRDTDEAP
jgi:DNA-binding NarL/FixJ family response regulator